MSVSEFLEVCCNSRLFVRGCFACGLFCTLLLCESFFSRLASGTGACFNQLPARCTQVHRGILKNDSATTFVLASHFHSYMRYLGCGSPSSSSATIHREKFNATVYRQVQITKEMDKREAYDYSPTYLFITKFMDPFSDKLFVNDAYSETCRKLRKFKDCLNTSCFKKYAYLLHSHPPGAPLLPMNMDERVSVISLLHGNNIALTVTAVDSNNEDEDHDHSIVVKVSNGTAAFDIDGLLRTMDGTSLDFL